MKRSLRTAAVAILALLSPLNAQTWTYNPDSGEVPNGAGQPLAYQSGSNALRSIVDLGGGDKVLQIDSSPNGANQSIYWGIDGPAGNWTVSDATGYSVEWTVRLDPTIPTNPSAAGMLAGSPTTYAFMRFYNNVTPGAIRAEIQSPSGGPAVIHDIGNPTAWHTYRMDVQSGTAKLYVDNYPWPVVTKAGLGAAAAHALWFGDGTGVDNGKYQIERVRAWTSGPVGPPAAPSVTDTTKTLFLAHYNGTTGNGGLNADYAVGNAAAVGLGGATTTPAKFGAQALDGYNASGVVSYSTGGNLNLAAGTIEMWVKPTNWSDGQYVGLFSATQAVASSGDIRLQKTNSGALQAIMGWAGYSKIWSLTSGPLALDTNWHHIAWTWDANVNKAALYVDGAVVTSTVSLTGLTTLGYDPLALNATFEVGSIQNGSGVFNGMIDELRISTVDLFGGQAFVPQAAAYPTPAGAPNGACCQPAGTCSDTTYASCISGGGSWNGVGTTCATTSCVTGACCLPNGSCQELTIAGCAAQSGQYQGDGSGCGSATCTPFATWSYEGDVAPEADTPAWQGFGSNAFSSLGSDSGVDYLQIDTSPNGDGNTRYYQINSGPLWNINTTDGFSLEWGLRLDPAVQTNPSAAAIVAGDSDTPFTIFRVYNGTGTNNAFGFRLVEVYDSGAGTYKSIALPASSDWHNYRLDVKGASQSVFIDNYPFPILTHTFTGATGGVQEIRWGDQTGSDNGKYQVDFLRSYQWGNLGIVNAPDPADPQYTQFLAHYDGTTGNGGLDADFAVGSPAAVALGGGVVAPGKFGAGSLDGITTSGTVTYATAGNFNVRRGTIEMWVRPNNWADGQFAGLFSATQSPAGLGDIRIQKTGGNSLQAVMGCAGYTQIWSLTSAPLSLSNGDWHHIAWTWDFDANRSALYVDGAVVADVVSYSGLATIDYRADVNPTFEIGSIQNGSAPFNGLIDEFRISGVDLYGGLPYTPASNAHVTPTQEPVGVCCAMDQACSDTTYAACTGTWQGAGTNCASNPCPLPPTGACCIPGSPGASCQDVSATECANLGGRYQGDYSVCASITCCNPPSPLDVTHTLLLAHFDGNTAQGGLDADYAAGSGVSSGTGGAIVAAPVKFGAGSLDPAAGVMTYPSLDNLNISAATIEMWVQTDNWADGQFNGLISLYQAGVGDIRLQKTSGNRLQAYMADLATNTSWSLTSDALALDANWHHIAWTWDFAGQKAALYIDGNVVDKTPEFGGITELGYSGTLPSSIEVGTIQGGSADFPGYIDELRITDTDLYCSANFTPAAQAWPTPPPSAPRGACCKSDLTCERLTQAVCEGDGGVYQGNFTSCEFVVCQRNPYADRDGDGDVDMDDFAEFQLCYSGPTPAGPLDPACKIFDRPEPGFPSGDNDVDSDDLAQFTQCLSGPKVPADTACDGAP